mgnify:CR=1 FL=1
MRKEMLEKVHNARKNLIVSGDISVGKTKNVIIPLVKEMIDNGESLVILDSKEEYLNTYYKSLKEKNYNIVILNFRDLNRSEGWNPLEYPYTLFKNDNKDKAIDYLDKIGSTMFYEGKETDPFWASSASDFFTGVTLGLYDDGNDNQINLNSVNAMFNGVDKRYGGSDYLTKYFDLKDKTSSAYVYACGTCYAPRETKGGILAVARQRLRTYTSREKLSILLNKTTIDLNMITEKPTAIFVIGKDEDKNINIIPTMFIEQIFDILLDKNNNRPYNFVLDNFDSILNINHLSDMLSSGLSRMVKFIIGTRSINDLKIHYGDYISKLCNTIIINDREIEMNLDSERISEDNTFNDNKLLVENIDYPKLENKKIELFDFNKYVVDNSLKNFYTENPDLKVPIDNVNNPFGEVKNPDKVFPEFSVDELITRIDDKIAELDRMEEEDKKKREEANKKNEIKSELEQFKIN